MEQDITRKRTQRLESYYRNRDKRVEIVAAYGKKYREKNRDKLIARDRAYHAANRERSLAKQKEYRAANKGVMRAWLDANKDRVRASSKAWKEANKDRVKEHKRNDYANNKGSYIEASHRRRAVMAKAPGKWSKRDLDVVYGILGTKCLVCGSDKVTVDHVIALALGGSNHPTNLQPLCKPCNSRKGAKNVEYRTKAQVRRLVGAFQLTLGL